MNTKLLLGIMVAVSFMAVPTALADHDESLVGAGGLYVAEDGTVWEESNDHDGLQTEDEFDDEGNLVLPADTQIL